MVDTIVLGALSDNPAYAQHGTLYSGGQIEVPAGMYALKLGPLLTLLRWNTERLCWMRQNTMPNGLHMALSSDGTNYRVANLTGCAVGVSQLSPGSGYNPANPPVFSTTRNPIRGFQKPVFRTYVGGACTMVLDTPGTYHLQPSLVFDVSQQTPPFVTPQFEIGIDASGHIDGFYQTGNDTGFPSYSGAGLDVSKLTATIVPHPDDTGVVPGAAHPVAAGAGSVTQIDVIDYGGPINNQDWLGTASITHNGGTGLWGEIAGDLFVSGYVIENGGQYGSVDSSVDEDYPQAIAAGGILDDEYGSPRAAYGTCVLTAGVITQINADMSGGKYQWRPRVIVQPHKTIPTSPGIVTAVLGLGNDQYSWQRLA